MMFSKLAILAVFGMAAVSEALLTNPLKTGEKTIAPNGYVLGRRRMNGK